MPEITWHMDEAEAVALLGVLTDVVEILDLEDNDAECLRISHWASELGDLIAQRRAWTAQIQPGLVGLA